MMEEIDRFQVPTAHSEMQPLVRGRAAGRPGPGGVTPEGREETRPWGLCEGAPSDMAGGEVLKTHLRGRETCRARKPWEIACGQYERRTWEGGGHRARSDRTEGSTVVRTFSEGPVRACHRAPLAAGPGDRDVGG